MPSHECKADNAENKDPCTTKESTNPLLEDDKKTSATLSNCEVVPRTIIGPAHSSNKGALDWGHHGLLAYGCTNTVAVLDTKNVQIIQTLDLHKAVIKKVLWVHGAEPNDDGSGRLQLVSGDSSGQIIHWDVSDGKVKSVLLDGNKPVIDMAWVPGHERELILATVHSPYFLIVWSVKKMIKLWKMSFTDTLCAFDFDPFSRSKLAFLCSDCILFVEDFQLHKVPSTNGRKFYVSAGNQSGRDRPKRLIRTVTIDDNKPRNEDPMTLNECLQLTYHRSLRDHLILLYPRDLLIIDISINQTFAIIPLDKSTSPVIQVLSCQRRDVLLLLHESGSVAVKVRKRSRAHGDSPSSPLPQSESSPPHQPADCSWYSSDITGYEGKCQSDVIWQSKSSKVLSLAVDPINETNFGVTLTCGKVVLLDLHRINPKLMSTIPQSITDVIPATVPLENIHCRLSIVGAVGRLNGMVTVARMSPHCRGHCSPLLSVGTSTGYLYLIHLGLGSVIKEFAVHSHPIRGIEWADSNKVFTFSHAGPAKGKVKNELHLTDIRNGRTIPVRVDRPLENPIRLVRVSPLCQYFVVIIENGPFELWEMTPQIGLLRTAPKKFPYVVALEWSPIRKRKVSTNESLGKSGKGKTTENLIYSDIACQLHVIPVEDDSFGKMLTILQELGDVTVTCLAFKANQILQGDNQGTLSMCGVTETSNHKESVGRSAIRYLRFAPGRANLHLLIFFADGTVRIVNLRHAPASEGHRSPGKLLSGIVSGVLPEESRIERVSELKPGGTIGRIIDADWASADLPVIITEDRTIRVMNIDLKDASSSILQYSLPESLSCPLTLGEGTLIKLQFLLATQFWKEEATIDNFQVTDGFTNTELTNVNKELGLLGLHKDTFSSLKTADKCLLISRLFGMPQLVDLWTIASYYIKLAGLRKDIKDDSSEEIKKIPEIEPLNTCYDYLMDSQSYRIGENERCFELRWLDHKQRQAMIDRLLLLGDMDRGVQLLLDTDINNPNYYTDAIKACLVATVQQSGAAQSTIKVVATNLIADGRIWQGVELLCLMGKGIDGCRYLAGAGLWESAVWLAKATLSPPDTLFVMKRFAVHLQESGDKFRAMLVMLSECEFDRALEILLSPPGDVFTAALLLFSCKDYSIPISNEISERIFGRLKDYLATIGNEEGAKFAAEQVGQSSHTTVN